MPITYHKIVKQVLVIPSEGTYAFAVGEMLRSEVEESRSPQATDLNRFARSLDKLEMTN